MLLTQITLVAGFSALAAAQTSASGLPQCAQACLGSNLGGCNSIDIQCICSNTSLIDSLACCVANTCSASEIAATVTFANALCGQYGVSLPSAASCAPGVATTTAVVGTGSAASSIASSISSVVSSVQSSISSQTSQAGTSAASATTATSVVAQTATAAAVAVHLAGGALGIGAAAVGVIALL